jgi:hypothetical protein
MSSSYQVALAGPVPELAADLVRQRIGAVTVRSEHGWTVLEGLLADQSAVRAMMTLLWDLGCDVRLLRVATTDDA